MNSNFGLGTNNNYNTSGRNGRSSRFGRQSGYRGGYQAGQSLYSAPVAAAETTLYEQATEAGQGGLGGFGGRGNRAGRNAFGGKKSNSRAANLSPYAGVQSPQQCPQDTYFRRGHVRGPTTRIFLDGRVPVKGSVVSPTCARMPRGNRWWGAIANAAAEASAQYGRQLSGPEIARWLKLQAGRGEEGTVKGTYSANLPFQPSPAQEAREARRNRRRGGQ